LIYSGRKIFNYPYLIFNGLCISTLCVLISCTPRQTKVAPSPLKTVQEEQPTVYEPYSGSILYDLRTTQSSFNPSMGETSSVTFRLRTRAWVGCTITDEDGFVIRTLIADSMCEPDKQHTLQWDGLDNKGELVPNEAYFPHLTVSADSVHENIHPLTWSGGIEQKIGKRGYDPRTGVITYSLPVASRVLIRAGIQNAALLKTVVDWQPRSAGTISESWNGKDEDNLFHLGDLPREASFVIKAYSLPQPCFITFGNKKQSYVAYRRKNDSLLTKRFSPTVFTARDVTLSRHFTQERIFDHAPKVSVTFPQVYEKDSTGAHIIKDRCLIRVDIDSADVQFIDDQYEITFYLDNEFFAEEELGYTPYTWLWKMNQVEPGYHILTVNVASYKDRIGIKNVRIKVER